MLTSIILSWSWSLNLVEQALWPSLNKSLWNQVTTDINYFNNVPFCMEDNEFIHDNSKVKLNLSVVKSKSFG